jgi:hypothetical protein
VSTKFCIKSISCEGMRGNIRYWHTVSAPKPSYLLELTIGEARTKKGGDIFTVLVITPEALRGMAEQESVVITDRATIVVTAYEFALIEAHLTKIVEACNRPEWSETVHHLRRYFLWEWDGIEEEARVINPLVR